VKSKERKKVYVPLIVKTAPPPGRRFNGFKDMSDGRRRMAVFVGLDEKEGTPRIFCTEVIKILPTEAEYASGR
jgi:hypothetical protein